MEKDIVPELLEAIQKDFKKEVQKNKLIHDRIKKIESGKADYSDVLEYSNELGKCVEIAFKRHVSDETLPDGKMYYNIAKSITEPFCEVNYEAISKKCELVQNALNEKAGIGLKAVIPSYDEEKTLGMVNYISSAEKYSEREKSYLQSFATNCKKIVDESVRQNADFHYRSGRTPKIIRIFNGNRTCQFCIERAGVYDYRPDMDRYVFVRHANCNCKVIYDPADGRNEVQDAHTKVWQDKEAIMKRINYKGVETNTGFKDIERRLQGLEKKK